MTALDRRQSSRRSAATGGPDGAKDRRTYVWVKLRDGRFVPPSDGGAGGGGSGGGAGGGGGGGGGGIATSYRRSHSGAVANKKRGAPAGAGGDGEAWGWAPGYYVVEPGAEAGTESTYKFALLGLDDASGTDGGGEGGGEGRSERVLSELAALDLLASHEVVLANPWEGRDFSERLEAGGGGGDDESDYDYDDDDIEDDDDDDDDDRGKATAPSHLFDAPEDRPPANLIDLTHLHEPSVVHALRRRYERLGDEDGDDDAPAERCVTGSLGGIYTDTGPILLAINPFRHDETDALYGERTVEKYRAEGEERWLRERRGGGAAVGGAGGTEGPRRGEEGGEGGGGGGGASSASSSSSSRPLPPHVYAVADRAFRAMMTRLHPPVGALPPPSSSGTPSAARPPVSSPLAGGGRGTPDRNAPSVDQSVLVSGESGAGKTVTTKLLMAYLSKLSEQEEPGERGGGDDDDDDEGGMSIERRVLESNPIVESFGNARTVRNDNSSRFGKYIEMKFASGGEGAALVGASIETYLLEKVRLVHQSPGERNYHIFYELFGLRCDEDDDASGFGPDFVRKIGLEDREPSDFNLVNASGTYDRRDGVSDLDTFRDLRRAMSVMGFAPSEVKAAFEITAALLHLSNVTFERVGEVECALEDGPHLDCVTDLLGIDREGLNTALCYYEITVGGGGRKGGETHRRVLSKEQCEKGAEALIKATYGALFDHLVRRINASVAGDDGRGAGAKRAPMRGGRAGKGASIGILDIFGFESFQVNSFEQLCINYCNESLQQQFNRFVLRNEQEEYDREGIPWSFIEFPENQDVLDLIDFKSTGILNILHDQCRIPGASNKTFAIAMYDKCSSHDRFEADSRQVAQRLFAVHHYAGLVEYDVEGFVEKTRDEVPKSGSDLLLSSKNSLVKTLAEILQSGPAAASTAAAPPPKGRKALASPRSGGAAQRPTVGVQFSSQLHALRRKIDDTSPHYVRCLKPNNLLVPDHFDAALIADQLRCAGVIEAVRVSRLGYPQRFTHGQFVARYRILGRKLKKNAGRKYNQAKALAHSILKRMEDQSDVGIQVGKTKVFLRRRAYDLLEKLRRERVETATVAIQKTARRYLCRKSFAMSLRQIRAIQCFVRMTSAQRKFNDMRRRHNSVLIQQTWRKYEARKLWTSTKVIALWCQTRYRGSVGRVRYDGLNRERKAQKLQSQWRAYLGLTTFRKKMNAIATIQRARRCHSARVELAARKAAARDLGAVKQERDQLRREAAALRDELALVREGGLVGKEKDAEIQSLRTALAEALKEKESSDAELSKSREELATLRSERDAVVVDRDDMKQVNKMLQTEYNSREEKMRSMMEEITMLKNTQENQSPKIVSTDTRQVMELKNELKHFMELSESLQRDNDRLKEEHSSADVGNDINELKDINASLQKDNEMLKRNNSRLVESVSELNKERALRSNKALESEKHARNSPVMIEDRNASNDTFKKAMTFEEKSPGAVNPSVCTSFTVDMDLSEEEMTRLREENLVLRKQLELLRVNHEESDFVSDSQDYDESVAPDSKSSTTDVADDNALTSSVMKQICSEVEIVTEEVIIKTRAESESKIAELHGEIEKLRAEIERNKRLTSYDLDNMTRVNRSLREDLEAVNSEKLAMEDELELKCEEFEALNEDLERFAETFATQHEELQQLESQTKKLQSENKRLKVLDEDRLQTIRDLETQLESKKQEWVGDEIGKLWNEIGKLRETPPTPPK